MEVLSTSSNKRKRSGESSIFPLNELNKDLLEIVLSWLPISSFFRLTSVSKKWKSVANSATFELACSQIPHRDPWFIMVDSRSHCHQQIIYDSTEQNWKKLNYTQNPEYCCSDSIPVAASGGLICFLRPDGDFVITNPITRSSRRLNSPLPASEQPIRAIAMRSKHNVFELFVVSGELTNLTFRRYTSTTDQWGEDIPLEREANLLIESSVNEDCTNYFLSKCGDIVSTDIQRSPSKQYSSLLTVKDNEEILYFLSSSGTIVACNLTRDLFFEYPRLLPVFSEYSIDLVECGGRMYVVLLYEFLESASLRVWTWDDVTRSWKQIAAMPPYMSHKLYGKKVDINCTGAGEKMMVCLNNSDEICSYVMCDLVGNEWVELPSCCINGEVKEFVCAFSFEPRIEASIWGRKMCN